MLFVPADEVLCRHVTTIFAPKVSADRDSAQLYCPGQRSAKLSGTALSYIVLHYTFPYNADVTIFSAKDSSELDSTQR